MIRTRSFLGTVLAAILLLATACDQGSPATPAVPSPTATVNIPPDTKIVLEVTGGIAGTRKTLEIDAKGEARLTEGGNLVGTTQLTPHFMAELLAKFAAANFFNLDETYDSGTVSDDFYNTVTFTSGGQSHTVKAAQIGGQGITPQPLLDLIAALGKVETTIRSST